MRHVDDVNKILCRNICFPRYKSFCKYFLDYQEYQQRKFFSVFDTKVKCLGLINYNGNILGQLRVIGRE